MGIDLTKLGKLHELAASIDAEYGDKNKKLDTAREISIFEGEVAKLTAKGELSADDVSEIKGIFGLEKKTSTTTPVELSKKDKKRYQNAVKDSVEKYVKQGVKPEDLMAALKKEFSNPEYAPMLNEVQQILNAVTATKYDSKEDIEKIKKTVKEDLDIGKRDWQYDVLNDLIDQAEEAQIDKEFKALVEMYNDVKKTMAGTDIVKKQGDNYKAYAEIVKDELQEKGADGKKAWDKSYTKEAYARLEDYIKKDAEAVVMAQITETTATKKRKWVKEMKAMNTAGDGYQTRARKDADTERKISLRHNKYEKTYEELGSISRDDLKKALGKDLFEKFNRSYLVKYQNEDGTYNLQELSDAIKMRAGADYYVNKSDDKEASERQNIKAEVASLLGLPIDEISNKDVKDIIKLVGLKRETNASQLKDLLKNSIPGILVGAISGGIAKGGAKNVTQTVDLIYDSAEDAKKIVEQLQSQGFQPIVTELTGGKYNVRVLQEVIKNDRYLNILMGAGVGVLQEALMTLLFGEETFEESCISITDYNIHNTRYTNKEQFIEYIKSRYPKEKAELLETLIETFPLPEGQTPTEESNWDHAGFFNKLREIAGYGSNLNCREMKGGRLYPDKDDDDDNHCDNNCHLEKDSGYIDTTLVHKVVYGDSWEGILKAYFPTWNECFDKMYGKGGAIQALKQALSTNSDGTLNNEMYQELLKGKIPSVINIPEKLGECLRNDDGKVIFRKPIGTPVGYLKMVGIKTGYDTVTLTDCDNNSATGKNVQDALDKLNQATGKNYTEEDILPDAK